MGNQFNPQRSFQLTREEFLSQSGSVWSKRGDYIYYNHHAKINSIHKYIIIDYQLDLQQSQISHYFEKLKMIAVYLSKGNLLLPVMCIADEEECFQWKIFDQTTSVKFYYQSFPIKLSDEVVARRKHKQMFRQAQIWYILYGLVNATRQFEPFSQKSGIVNYQQIVFNTKGQFSLKNYLTYLNIQNQLKNDYLSPQEMELMGRFYGRYVTLDRSLFRHANINPNICQVYTVGIISLSLVFLCSPEHFYRFDIFQMNLTALNQALSNMIELRYSKLLTNILKVMLSPYHNRPLPSQIYQTLKPYQNEIMNLIPFKFRPKTTSFMI